MRTRKVRPSRVCRKRKGNSRPATNADFVLVDRDLYKADASAILRTRCWKHCRGQADLHCKRRWRSESARPERSSQLHQESKLVEAARLSPHVACGRGVGVDLCADQRCADRRNSGGVQPRAHVAGIRVARDCLPPFVARHSSQSSGSGCSSRLLPGYGYQFQTIGLVRTTPSKSAFITGLVVVLVTILVSSSAASAQRAFPRWNAYTGAILAFVGILLLTAPASVQARGHAWQYWRNRGHASRFLVRQFGDLLTFGCADWIRVSLPRAEPRIAPHPVSAAGTFCSGLLRIIHGHQPAHN